MRHALLLLLWWSSLPAAQLPEAVSLSVRDQPLRLVLEQLAARCAAGLVIHHAAQADADLPVTVELERQPWSEVERTLLMYRIELALVGEVLMVEDVDTAGASRRRRMMHATAVTTRPRESFPGPRLGVQALPQGVHEVATSVFDAERDSTVPDLVEGLQHSVAPDSWAHAGVSIMDFNGVVVVNQTPPVQAEIAARLAEHERRAARQLVIRCYRLPTPPPGTALALDAASWSALAKDLAPPEAVFTTLDGQRNHHWSGVRRSYLGADVAENGLGTPVMGMVASGLVLEVEAHITVAGVSADIRLQATTAEAMASTPVNDAAGHLHYAIDLPEQRQDQAEDVRLIPDGGATLYRFDDRTYAITATAMVVGASP